MKISEQVLSTVICPGCGWTGMVDNQDDYCGHGRCPNCKYEHGRYPHRLVTLAEMLEEGERFYDLRYDQVQFDMFLKSLFKLIEEQTE